MKTKQTHKEEYDYLAHSASATECTGLIPTPAATEEARNSYEAVYPFMPKSTKKNHSSRR